MAKYLVELSRTITEYANAEIEAENPDEAYDLAEGLWGSLPAEAWQTDGFSEESSLTVFDPDETVIGAP